MIHPGKPQLGETQPTIDILSYGLKEANILDLKVVKPAIHPGIPLNSSTYNGESPSLLKPLTTYNSMGLIPWVTNTSYLKPLLLT